MHVTVGGKDHHGILAAVAWGGKGTAPSVSLAVCICARISPGGRPRTAAQMRNPPFGPSAVTARGVSPAR
ncbi:hypothetical protein Pen01_73930 [Phytomonospora endophytica]|nr:hypothetical protein Pen01_73930 [Phytomonospora endophytica]